MDKTEKLISKAAYRGHKYGTLYDSYERIIQQNKIPLFVISPDSIMKGIIVNGKNKNYLTLYLDADNILLDERLRFRDGKINDDVYAQRDIDRKHIKYSDYYLLNNQRVSDIVQEVITIIENCILCVFSDAL